MSQLVEVKAHFLNCHLRPSRLKQPKRLNGHQKSWPPGEKRLQETFDQIMVAHLASELAKADFSEAQT